MRQKKRARTNRYRLLIILLILLALVCSLYLIARYRGYQEGIEVYDMIQSRITVEEPEDPQREADIRNILGDNLAGRAWIYCPATPINYPVMQAGDNQYYLNHLPDGRANGNGSIFLDYRNAPDFTDDNSILYGHRMMNGTMFGGIAKYTTTAYYEQKPYFYLYTNDKSYKVELFAGYVLDGGASLPLSFEEGGQQAFIEESKAKSKFQSSVAPSSEDRLLTMVTCDYAWDNARFVLTGRLVPLS